jgi:hypothetical protein
VCAITKGAPEDMTSADPTDSSSSAEGGQVSDAENLRGEPTTPIADDQAVAGYPESESGMPDEGPAGPNANTNAGDSTGEPVPADQSGKPASS